MCLLRQFVARFEGVCNHGLRGLAGRLDGVVFRHRRATGDSLGSRRLSGGGGGDGGNQAPTALVAEAVDQT
jgi:hypothetical protein